VADRSPRRKAGPLHRNRGRWHPDATDERPSALRDLARTTKSLGTWWLRVRIEAEVLAKSAVSSPYAAVRRPDTN